MKTLMHWELVFPTEQQVHLTNPDLLRKTSSEASTLLAVEIQMITLTSDKRLQKYRGKNIYYQLFYHPQLPEVDSMQLRIQPMCSQDCTENMNLCGTTRQTSKVHPKPIFLVTHKTGTASCGTSNSIILVFVFISMYWRQVIDSFSVCSCLPAALCLNF